MSEGPLPFEESVLDQIARIRRQCFRDVERALVSQIEIVEGRMPSDDEIRRHGRRIGDGFPLVEIFWKGERVVRGEFGFDVGDGSLRRRILVRHKTEPVEESDIDFG